MSDFALGLTTINGLPAHVLIVHAVVVFLPLTALYLIAASLRSELAVRAGLFGPGLAAVALLSILAAMNAGGWLQAHVPNTALVRRHTGMAGDLWPFSLVMLALSIVIWARHNRDGRLRDITRRMPVGGIKTTAAIAILAVLAGVGGVVETVRIGESGARAAWTGHFSTAPVTTGSSK